MVTTIFSPWAPHHSDGHFLHSPHILRAKSGKWGLKRHRKERFPRKPSATLKAFLLKLHMSHGHLPPVQENQNTLICIRIAQNPYCFLDPYHVYIGCKFRGHFASVCPRPTAFTVLDCNPSTKCTLCMPQPSTHTQVAMHVCTWKHMYVSKAKASWNTTEPHCIRYEAVREWDTHFNSSTQGGTRHLINSDCVSSYCCLKSEAWLAAAGPTAQREGHQLGMAPTSTGLHGPLSFWNQFEVWREAESSLLAEHWVQVAWASAAHLPGPLGQRNQSSAEKSNYHGLPWAVPRVEPVVRDQWRWVSERCPCGVCMQLSIWPRMGHSSSW